MTELTLTADQLSQFTSAPGVVVLVDGAGHPVGYAQAIHDDPNSIRDTYLAELRRRRDSNEPRFSTEQVLQHLKTLENP